jgi:hypothetical protein
MFVSSASLQEPPAVVAEINTSDIQIAPVLLPRDWRDIPIRQALQDPKLLEQIAASPYVSRSADNFKECTDAEIVTEAVARFNHSFSDLPRDVVRNLRAGLSVVAERATDPYTVSVARLYQILPTEQSTPQLRSAIEIVPLFEAKYGEKPVRMQEGESYPAVTLRLFAELDEALNVLPPLEEAKRLREIGANKKFSPLIEENLLAESVGLPPEIAMQARGELAEILSSIQPKLLALRNPGVKVTPEQVMNLIYDQINEHTRCLPRDQRYLLDGLASRTYDCDVYSKVFYEVGQENQLDIKLLYLAGVQHGTGVGHCMPMLELRRGRDILRFVFETREPIERLPDGSARRLYKEPTEIAERINGIAGRVLIGDKDKPFIGNKAFVLSQVPSRDPETRERMQFKPQNEQSANPIPSDTPSR